MSESDTAVPAAGPPRGGPRPAVFLDRDGVINENLAGRYVEDWATFRFLPGAVEAVAALKRAGYPVVVVTNQAGIAHGRFSADALEEIHRQMADALRAGGGGVDAVLHCPHHPQAGCDCRKPQPGMLRRAAERLDLDLARSVLVGDHLTDLQAARAAGCRAILVLTGRGRDAAPLLAADPDLAAVPVVADLPAAVRLILAAP
ncbi:MAG TPA: D-glycero-beta-D-manno-heptose 1,7-bisphosphate 7-phosphatase [Chloroflexota bacterium]|nr:D-glycero-beta-D-manno-heptose 1,7-bisphosphate 7-phosphatase [Chloroflexota bacterium]